MSSLTSTKFLDIKITLVTSLGETLFTQPVIVYPSVDTSTEDQVDETPIEGIDSSESQVTTFEPEVDTDAEAEPLPEEEKFKSAKD